MIVVRLAIFGAAILYFLYRPKTIAKAVARACDTPDAAGACDTHVVPLLVNTLPDVLGATVCTADVPLPRMTLFSVRVVAPVPPLATPSVPVMPVVSGSPVAFVRVKVDGVPRFGVVNAGESVSATTVPVPLVVYEVPHADPVEFGIPAPG